MALSDPTYTEFGDMYSIIKLDIDITVPDTWLKSWIKSRKRLLADLDKNAKEVYVRASVKKGYHIWIHLEKPVTYLEMEFLQFMLGNDYNRIWFHRQRRGFPHRRQFDLLFSEKIQLNATP